MAPAVGELSTKPPRPNVRVGALLMIIGAVVTAICTALPWLKVDGANGNGFDDYFSNRDGELKILQGPGKIWIFFAVVVVGLGIALYLAGRVLAVAIIGIVFAAIGAFFVLGSITIASDNKDLASAAGNDASLQFGLYLGIVGMLVALAGAITATAKRRR